MYYSSWWWSLVVPAYWKSMQVWQPVCIESLLPDMDLLIPKLSISRFSSLLDIFQPVILLVSRQVLLSLVPVCLRMQVVFVSQSCHILEMHRFQDVRFLWFRNGLCLTRFAYMHSRPSIVKQQIVLKNTSLPRRRSQGSTKIQTNHKLTDVRSESDWYILV